MVPISVHLVFVCFEQRIDFLQEQEFTIDGEITLAPAQPVSGVDIFQEEGNLVCTLLIVLICQPLQIAKFQSEKSQLLVISNLQC